LSLIEKRNKIIKLFVESNLKLYFEELDLFYKKNI